MANVLDLYNGKPVAIVERKTRVKRTETQMLESCKTDPLSEAHYLKTRLQKLEDKISELIAAASPEARELILTRMTHLGRYLP
jgi:hypothetical protein